MSDGGLASDCFLVPERVFVLACCPARAHTALTLFVRTTA